MFKYIFGLLLFFIGGQSYSQQFDIAGSAADVGGLCYELTNTTGQSGAVWNQNTIDLTQPFDISLTLNFGCNDPDNFPDPNCGADGISFVLQPNGTGAFGSGGGVGFNGITPSLGVVMDNYSNGPDDNFAFDNGVDHISLNSNGDVIHGSGNELVDPTVGAGNGFPSNIEDCNDHDFRFTWDPATQTVEVYFDGTLTISYTGDIVTNIFGGNPTVFWGVSASTGGCWNIQTVCFEIMADFASVASACLGETIDFTDQSQSTTAIVSWDWDFGDGNTSTDQHPSHTYAAPGTYDVTLEVEDMGGFTLNTTIQVEIFDLPAVTANADVNPLCEGEMVTLTGGGADTYVWDGGVTDGTAFLPTLGTTTYNVTGTDVNLCENTASIDVVVNANPTPSITGTFDFCTGSSTTIDAGSYDTYSWSSGETTQTVDVTVGGDYTVTVTDANGCTATDMVTVTENPDLSPSITGTLAICEGVSTMLDAGAGYVSYIWSTTETSQTIDVTTGADYSVSVADANGCTGTATVTVTENINPTPDITGILAICSGDATDLDAGAGYLGYLWSTTETSQSINVTAADEYSVTVVDANGCTGTDMVTVTENTNPTPDITGVLSICDGVETILDAGTGYAAYSWSTTETFQIITTTVAGDYTVTVTDNNGCTGTDMVTLVVNPLPVVDAGSDQTVCNGGSVTLNVTGGTFYLWSSGETNSSINVSPTVSTDYFVTVTDSNGCTGTDDVTVNIAEVYVDLGTDRTVCTGDVVSLFASVTMGTLPITYTWSTGDVTPALSMTPTSNGSYFVTVLDANGCTASDQIVVSIHPDLNFSLSVSENAVCEGESVTFSGSISGGPGAPYYVWHEGNMVVLPYTAYPASDYVYTFTAEDMCGQQVDQFINITVNPTPDFTISSDITATCPPENINFTVTPITGDPFIDYTWSFEDVNSGFSNIPNPTYEYENDGVFDVSLTVRSQDGCTNTKNFEDFITVHPLPTASFTPDPKIVSIIDSEIFFENYSELGDYFFWDFDDGDSSSQVNPVHEFEQIGDYNVQLVVNTFNGCTDTVYHLVSVVNEFTFFAPSAFTPNNDDVNDLFYVVGNGINAESFQMFIYDRWGEMVYHTNEYDIDQPELSGWDGKVNNSRNKCESGVYTWLVVFNHIDGPMHEYAGSVTLMR